MAFGRDFPLRLVIATSVVCVLTFSFAQMHSAIGAQGKGESRKGDSEEVRKDLKAAIESLRNGDIEAFFLNYMPVEHMRQMREQEDLPAIFENAPREQLNKMVEDMSKFQDAPIEFGPNQLTATFILKLERDKPVAVSLRETKKKPAQVGGYGRVLQTAVDAALADLSTDPVKFGKSILPISQVIYFDELGWDAFKQSLASHVAGSRTKEQIRSKTIVNPIVQQDLIKRDLEAIKNLKPAFKNDGAKAVYTLPFDTASGFPQPENAKQIVFELVDGNWRLYSGSDLQEAILEQFKNEPVLDKSVRTMQLEKIGGTWRLMVNSFK